MGAHPPSCSSANQIFRPRDNIHRLSPFGFASQCCISLFAFASWALVMSFFAFASISLDSLIEDAFFVSALRDLSSATPPLLL